MHNQKVMDNQQNIRSEQAEINKMVFGEEDIGDESDSSDSFFNSDKSDASDNSIECPYYNPSFVFGNPFNTPYDRYVTQPLVQHYVQNPGYSAYPPIVDPNYSYYFNINPIFPHIPTQLLPPHNCNTRFYPNLPTYLPPAMMPDFFDEKVLTNLIDNINIDEDPEIMALHKFAEKGNLPKTQKEHTQKQYLQDITPSLNIPGTFFYSNDDLKKVGEASSAENTAPTSITISPQIVIRIS